MKKIEQITFGDVRSALHGKEEPEHLMMMALTCDQPELARAFLEGEGTMIGRGWRQGDAFAEAFAIWDALKAECDWRSQRYAAVWSWCRVKWAKGRAQTGPCLYVCFPSEETRFSYYHPGFFIEAEGELAVRRSRGQGGLVDQRQVAGRWYQCGPKYWPRRLAARWPHQSRNRADQSIFGRVS